MGVCLHRFVESAELHGENVLRFEAGRAVEERRRMEVNFHEGIAVGSLGGRHAFRFGTRRCRTAVGGSGSSHRLLQRFGIDHHGIGRPIIAHEWKHQRRLGEKLALAESMQFVELGGVHPKGDVERCFERKSLVGFEGEELHGEAFEFGKGIVAELFEENLLVRLHHPFMTQPIGGAFLREEKETDVKIAVVDQIGFKLRGGELLGIDGQKTKEEIELIAAATFERTGAESDVHIGQIALILLFLIGRVTTEDGFDARGTLCRRGIGGRFVLSRRAHKIVVVRFDHDHFGTQRGHFKAIVVAHQHDVFALKSCYFSASCGVEEAHFIADVHKNCSMGKERVKSRSKEGEKKDRK